MPTRRDPSDHRSGFAFRALLVMLLVAVCRPPGPASGQDSANKTANRRIIVPMAAKVRSVSIAGPRIAVATETGEVHILDRQEGRAAIPAIHHSPAPDAVSLSPDGRRLALGGPREVIRETQELKHVPLEPITPENSPFPQRKNGQFGEAWLRDWTFIPQLVHVRSGPPLIDVTRLRGGLLEIRDLDTSAPGTRIELPDPLVHLHYSAGDLMAIDEKGMVAAIAPASGRMAEPQAGSIRRFLREFPEPLVVWDAENRRVVTLTDMMDKRPRIDERIHLTGWDRRAGRVIDLHRAEDSPPPWGLAVDPAGKLLATCGPGGTITLRDLDTGAVRKSVRHGDGVGKLRNIAFRRDGALLMTAGGDGKVWIWDLALDWPLLVAPGPDRDVRAVAFDRDQLTVVSGAYRDSGPLVIDHYDVSALGPNP